jgi:hypothetical protein
MLPMFSPAEADTRFLSCRVVFNPLLTAFSGEGARFSLVSRDSAIESLIGGS